MADTTEEDRPGPGAVVNGDGPAKAGQGPEQAQGAVEPQPGGEDAATQTMKENDQNTMVESSYAARVESLELAVRALADRVFGG